MTIKTFNKKRKKIARKLNRFFNKKAKRIKFYKTLKRKKFEKKLEDERKNKLSIRLLKKKIQLKKRKVTKRTKKVLKIKRYFANILRRKYRRKLRIKFKRKVVYSKKSRIRNTFLTYKERKSNRLLRRITFIFSYLKVYNNKLLVRVKEYFANKKNNKTTNIVKQNKTFTYNTKIHKFVIRKKDYGRAKNTRNIQTNSMLIKIKNIIWNIIYLFKFKNKKRKKKARHLRFKIRMLNKHLYIKKHQYRTNKLYASLKKKTIKKRIKFKLKNNKTKKVKIKLNKNTEIKRLKVKRLLKILKKIKKQNNKHIKLIQNFLHYIKRETLTPNTIIKRKQKRKFYWLTYLYFTKSDIKNDICLRIFNKPLLLKKLIILQQ